MAVGLNNEVDRATTKSLGMKSICESSKRGRDGSEDEG